MGVLYRSAVSNAYFRDLELYPVLTRSEEQILGKQLIGESHLETLISEKTFAFADNYLVQAAGVPHWMSFMQQEYQRYNAEYRFRDNPAEGIDALRACYKQHPNFIRGFIAATAHYLHDYSQINSYYSQMNVPPPSWIVFWKRMNEASGASTENKKKRNENKKKRNATASVSPLLFRFSEEIDLYARENPDAVLALHKAYMHTYKTTSAAFAALINANQRLVLKIAKTYTRERSLLFDSIQEGNHGLMLAAERFEYERGFKFSTHATWWIKQAIRRAVPVQESIIYIPSYARENISKVNTIFTDYLKLFGRKPTRRELDDEITSKLRIFNPQKKEDLIRIWNMARIESLDAPGEDGKRSLGERYCPPEICDCPTNLAQIKNPDEDCYQEALQEAIENSLTCLTPMQERVIRLRYGLGELEKDSLQEIANEYSLSRERIRQIEVRALRRLRTLRSNLCQFL